MIKQTTPFLFATTSTILLSSVVCADTQSKLFLADVDLSEKGQAIHIGEITALNGDLNTEGIVFSASIGLGRYDYATTITPNLFVEGKSLQLEAGVGYQWVNSGSQVSIYTGVDYQDHDISRNDINNSVQGKDTGIALQLGATTRNSPIDVSLVIKFSKANNSYKAKGRFGHQVGKAKVGLELVSAGNNSYDEKRYGLYAAIPISHKANLNLSFGFLDSDRKTGMADHKSTYATVGFSF